MGSGSPPGGPGRSSPRPASSSPARSGRWPRRRSTVLFQVGATVAVGVLIDTFLVRSILVPAITTLVGEWAWWPSGARGLGRIAWPITVTMPASDVPVAGLAAASGGGPEDAVGGPTRWRRLAVAVLLVALVPDGLRRAAQLVAGGPDRAPGPVTAAVVNEDEGTTATAADGTVTKLDLGGDLVARLTGDTDGDTFAWQAIDADEAATGWPTDATPPSSPSPPTSPRTIAAIPASGGSATPKATLGWPRTTPRAPWSGLSRGRSATPSPARPRSRSSPRTWTTSCSRSAPPRVGWAMRPATPTASRPARPTSPTRPTARRPWPASSSAAWKRWPTGPLPRARARRRWRRA